MFSIFGKKKPAASAAHSAREPSETLLGNPAFVWRGERGYPAISIRQDHIAGLAEWLMKILQKSALPSDEPYDVLVADIWPNDGMTRLIGHVQLAEYAIGDDTGFRVCAYLEGGGIEGGLEDDEADIPLIARWLNAAVATEPLPTELRQRAVQNPFEIRLCLEGMGPLEDAIRISF